MSDSKLLERLDLDAIYEAQVHKALEHSSFSREQDGSRGNERMEFLGDAVLDLVISEYLYRKHPDWNEGRLTRARAYLVNSKALAQKSRNIGIGEFIRLGRTELASKGSEKDRILANVFEAIIAAVYLQGGYGEVRRICEAIFSRELQRADLGMTLDPKTELNEWAHSEQGCVPTYRTIDDTQEEGGRERFLVEVELAGCTLAEARGRSKRLAEREAAKNALANRKNMDER